MNKGNHPQVAELFRLVIYFNLPGYITSVSSQALQLDVYVLITNAILSSGFIPPSNDNDREYRLWQHGNEHLPGDVLAVRGQHLPGQSLLTTTLPFAHQLLSVSRTVGRVPGVRSFLGKL